LAAGTLSLYKDVQENPDQENGNWQAGQNNANGSMLFLLKCEQRGGRGGPHRGTAELSRVRVATGNWNCRGLGFSALS
jgi:hypothetical protein